MPGTVIEITKRKTYIAYCNEPFLYIILGLKRVNLDLSLNRGIELTLMFSLASTIDIKMHFLTINFQLLLKIFTPQRCCVNLIVRPNTRGTDRFEFEITYISSESYLCSQGVVACSSFPIPFFLTEKAARFYNSDALYVVTTSIYINVANEN